MNSTHGRTLTRLAAGAFLATGLALGSSLAMADVAYADTRTSDASSSDTRSSTNGNSGSKSPNKATTNRDRQAHTGLNGTLPQRPITSRLDQFKHLPFDPAMPGGD